MTKTRKVVKKLFTAVGVTAAVSMAAGFMTHTNVYADNIVYGDVDLNGSVTSNDALFVLKNCTHMYELTADTEKAADVDADGKVTANDALTILKKVVHVVDHFKAEEAYLLQITDDSQITGQKIHYSIDDIPVQVDREIVITLENGETKTVVGHFEKEFANDIVELLNEYREENGLEPLTVNDNLTYAAEVRAYEATAVWAHVRPDGSAWYTVSEEAYGENLASGFEDAETTMQGWMKSPGHNANMLKEDYESIGVGVFAVLDETEGKAEYTYYCTQLFGY